MNTCTRCGGRFPTHTSGIAPGVVLCTSAAQCDANVAARRTPATVASVNAALRGRGVAERLTRGRGYYYFRGGAAATWPESSVGGVAHVGALTIEQWIAERDRLAGAR